jgi:GNAT superfamily N-acetyltransferase
VDGVDILRFTTDDWPAYRVVRLAALAESPGAYCSTLAGEQAKTEADWRARLDRGATFAARAAGRHVGIATGVPGERDGHAELVGMWVDPAWRRQGVGRLLVQVVIDWAVAEARFRDIALWVAADNPGAEALYAGHGFRRTGAAESMRPDEPDRLIHEMSRAL